jgi:branched-chain amino acid transport system permease protein
MSEGTIRPAKPAATASWLTSGRRLTADVLSGRGGPAVPLAVLALAVLFPWWSGNIFWIRELTLIGLFALIISGLNVSFGYAGEVQFGQIAMFALGGYITAALANHITEIIPLLLISGAAAAILGALIALPALRLGGWALAMASFFLVILVPDVTGLLPGVTGGYIGLSGVPFPTFFGHPLGGTGLFETAVIGFGNWLRVIRQSPVLALSLGMSVRRVKVTAYAFSAFPAGLAGCLFTFVNESISPDSFGLDIAIGVVAASILGGTESVYGALLGAAIMQWVPLKIASFQQYSLLIYGLFLLAAGLLFGPGISGLARFVGARLSALIAPQGTGTVAADAPAGDGPGFSLAGRGAAAVISGIVKNFGGVHALDDVSLQCRPGTVTTIIGANGSGKTTLLNVISGLVKADAGSIQLDGREILGRPASWISAQGGVARTFQTPMLPEKMTIGDVVASGQYLRVRSGVLAAVLRLPQYWRTRRADQETSGHLLAALGLQGKAGAAASAAPLGQRRLIELARAVAAEPRLLLLDEPASGLSREEVTALGVILRRLAESGATIVLVEHNFQFVLKVSDQIYALELGHVIAQGTPAEIEVDPRVISSYLGMKADREATL